jgi:hypothetical protein
VEVGRVAGAFFGLLSGEAYGKWLERVFGPECVDREERATVDAFPSSDELFARLHASGWSVGDSRILTPDGLRWRVLGANGENVIDATGETQAEAWHRAAEQARALGMLGRASPS